MMNYSEGGGGGGGSFELNILLCYTSPAVLQYFTGVSGMSGLRGHGRIDLVV